MIKAHGVKKNTRGSLREMQRCCGLHWRSRSNRVVALQVVVGCTQGVALLLTYVGADCCGLEGRAPTLLALCPLLHCFRRFGGDAHPQVLLRPVSLPVHNDEIACHHSAGGHDMILFKK